MKKISISILIIFLFIVVLSYSIGNSNILSVNEPLRSHSNSGGGGVNYVESFYNDLLENSPALKKLEKDLSDMRIHENDLDDKKHSFEYKPDQYYNDAKYKATLIQDSVLKRKMLSLIQNSNTHYNSKLTSLNSLMDQMSQNNIRLEDHHAVLKLVLTLPIIEKYQKDNYPNEKEYKDFIQTQSRMIQRMDSLCPKY